MTEGLNQGMSQEFVEERFTLAKERVEQIASEQGQSSYDAYFQATAVYLLGLCELWDVCKPDSLRELPLERLREINASLYCDLLPENYGVCYGNPEYAVTCFGQDMGRLLSFLYAEIHSQVEALFEQDKEELVLRMELFLEIYQVFVCAGEEGTEPDYEQIRQIVYWFISDYSGRETEKRVHSQLDPAEDFALRIVMESELSDSRYLYYYGEYVTENEEKLSAYLNALPEETVCKMADTFTEGYRIGFLNGGKDITKKKTVNIRYELGFERIIRRAVLNFRKMGLEPVIYRASLSVFHRRGTNRIGYYGAEPNRQFLYDHKEDQALFLDKKYVSRKLEELRRSYESIKELAYVHGGPACMESFGEEPFAPQSKAAACHYTKEQQQLSVEYASASGQIVNEYIKGEERSFTIIAFPTPKIGERFEEIFDAVIEINTLDYTLYQTIQQRIIDTLDQAESVRIRGCGKNRTDLKVALHPLTDPEKETKFENCVADVNIPVGEVFTSPKLEGTEGTLHVTKVFLNGLEYRDLSLVFENGMVTDYTCGNFEDPTEAAKYVKDNVLFHHETLPMGEFAIGTNTTAYVAGILYQIQDKLPILIAEKTGPHFAVGDTCYSHSEDLKVYNRDGKEIIARDNSCSLLRKTEPSKAYFNCHTDITIPYDELGELTAVAADGREFPVIRAGRFVLAGCEELNRPFEKLGERLDGVYSS